MQSQPITNKVNLLDTETIRNTLQRGSTILYVCYQIVVESVYWKCNFDSLMSKLDCFYLRLQGAYLYASAFANCLRAGSIQMQTLCLVPCQRVWFISVALSGCLRIFPTSSGSCGAKPHVDYSDSGWSFSLFQILCGRTDSLCLFRQSQVQ